MPQIYIRTYIEKVISWLRYSQGICKMRFIFSTSSPLRSTHFFHWYCCAYIPLVKKVINSRYSVIIYIYIYIYIWMLIKKFIWWRYIFFSFSHEHLKHQTALSGQFWRLKYKGLTPEIQWSILKKSNTPKFFDSKCNLCLEEKIQIMIYPDLEKLLNQRCELIARCRHRNKFKL